MLEKVLYDESLNKLVDAPHVVAPWLTTILGKLETDPDSVVREATACLAALTKAPSYSVTADLLRVGPEPFVLLGGLGASSPAQPLAVATHDLYRASSTPETAKAVVGALGGLESSYLNATYAPNLDVRDPDLAPLLVAIEYLSMLEGDLWVKVRGAGLAYGCGITYSTDERLLKFYLYRSTDIVGAADAAAEVVLSYVLLSATPSPHCCCRCCCCYTTPRNSLDASLVRYARGEAAVNATDLEGAAASLAYALLAGESTRPLAVSSSWQGALSGRGDDYLQWLLGGIDKVTPGDVLHAIKKYVVPLLDPATNVVAATVPPGSLAEVHTALEARRGATTTGVLKIADADMETFFRTGRASAVEGAVEVCPPAPPTRAAGMAIVGGFAKLVKCACPRCE